MSCAGVEPAAGKLIFIRPENPTHSWALISNCGSLLINPQAGSSITSVKVPAPSSLFAIVNATGEGGGL